MVGLVGALLTLMLVGCAYKVEPVATPSYNVVSSYGEKVPGTWLLYVDAAQLDRPIKPDGYACSLHSFPLQLSSPFGSSIRQTLENVLQSVEEVPSPVSREQIRARDARGLIIVRGEEVRSHIEAKPGFWTPEMEGQVSIIASVAVDGTQGRLFGQTFEGQARGNASGGFACEGGAKGLASAAGTAMGDVSRKIGEAISNAERIRLSKG